MSAPDDDAYTNSPPPPPPKERPLSQTSSHGIRIVPYSPPRLSRDERTASQSSSATASLSGSQQHQYQPHVAAERDWRGGSGGVGKTSRSPGEGDLGDSRVYATAASQGRATSSSAGSAAAAKDGLVSGTKPAAPQSEGVSSAAPPRTPPSAADWTPTPAGRRRNPSSAFNAPSQSQSEQTRRPLATGPTLTLAPKPPSLRLPSGPAGAGDGAATATAAAGGPGPAVPRPRSRRRNMISMHSDNKTFSIVLNTTGGNLPSSSTSSTRGSWSATSASASGSGTTRGTWSSSQAGRSSAHSSNITSPPLSGSLSTVRTVDSREGLSDAFLADDDQAALSPLTSSGTIPGTAHFPFPPSPGEPSTRTHLTEDPKTAAHSSSPWNYRMVGGLRKVPNTPDFKQKQVAQLHSSEREQTLSPLGEAAASTPSPILDHHAAPSSRALEHTPTRPLVSKDSFASDRTVETTSETSNYKVYSRSSPPAPSDESLPLPSSSHSNYVLLGESSPIAAPSEQQDPSPPPSSHDGDENYILHGDPSPSPSVSLVARRQPRPKFSQESLVVPPLQPVRRRSSERLGYYKSRSRESLRARANSAKSLKSITSIIAGESVQSILVNSALVPGLRQQQSPGGAGPSPSSFASRRQQLDSWASSAPAPASPPSGSQPQPQPQPPSPQVPMVEAHPHQWSSQLSTVMSETEPSSSERAISPISRTASRWTGSISNMSGAGTGSGSGNGRRQSTGWASSTHSRQMLSISSSLAAQLEESRSQSRSMSMSRSDSLSLERPAAAYPRNGYNGGSRTIRDHDEDGDGIADLRDLSPRPSRSGLSGFLSNLSDSSRNLHSSSSSRSFNSSSLPTWARVYYGSGERRQFSAPSISDMSEGPISRPGSVLQQDPGSPGAEHFPVSLYAPRRRVREVEAGPSQRPFSDQASLDVVEAPPSDLDYNAIRPNLRKKTSSIWSPHLGMDRRAMSSRYSRWDPPSVSWSAESGVWGRRNAQVVMFVLGFIFPFAWMIAAFLPLPEQPRLEMLERDHSRSELGIPESIRRQFNEADDMRYQSARWWRNLNRGMSLVGLAIIGVTIGLVVVGIKQGWYQRA